MLKSHCSGPGRLGSPSGRTVKAAGTLTGIPLYRVWPIYRMSGVWRLPSIYLQNAKGPPCVSRFGSETIAYAQRLATVSHGFGEIPLSRAGPRGPKGGSEVDPKGTRNGSPFGPKGDQNGTPFWPKRGPKWDPFLAQKVTKMGPLSGPKGDRKWARNKSRPGSGRSPGRPFPFINAMKNSSGVSPAALLN